MATTTRRAPARRTKKKRSKVQAQSHDDLLHSFDDKVLDCRDIRHRWQRMGFFRQGTSVRRRLVCENCDTERLDRWRQTRRGVIRERPDYRYKEGYGFKGESFSLSEIRAELLNRVEVFESEEALLESFANGSRRRMRSVS